MDPKAFQKRTTIIPCPGRREAVPVDHRVYLVVLKGTNMGQIFALEEGVTVIGRDASGNIQLLDSDVSRRHAQISFDPVSRGYFLEDLGSSNGTLLNEQRISTRKTIQRGDKIAFGHHTILRVSYGDEIETAYAQQMFQAILKDGLTGVYNRRHFEEQFPSEISFAIRHHIPLSLIMFDIDHFKQVNDTYGHLAGDAILKSVAQVVQESIRAEDILARYGGEEFVIICRQTNEQGASILAERIRRELEQIEYVAAERTLRVTISLGVACFDEQRELAQKQALIDAADKALYAAKQGGRNRVVVYSTIR